MLKGKCALITGSTGGLGYAIAEGLAAAGCNIVLNGFAPPAEIEAMRARLETSFGVRAVYHGADLARPAEIEALVAAAAEALGGVDILVNNAVVRHFAPVEEFPVERWDAALAVNLSAAFHTIRLALPGMRARGYGRIVNLSSVLGLFATAHRIDYVTTKTALIGMTRAVATEVLKDNVTCNAICPGAVLTPYSDAKIASLMAAEGLPREAAVARFLGPRQPAGRFVEASAVAGLVVFLCSPAGRDINGVALPVDTGWSAGQPI